MAFTGLLLTCTLLAVGNVCAATTTPEPPTTNTPQASNYYTTSGQCGGYLTNSRGLLTSPNYPGNYPSNAQCTWTIHASGYSIIQLQFSYLMLETDASCQFDSVSVYDGPSTSYPLVGRLCGGRTRMFNSTRNDLTVVFRSDSSSNYKGFEAVYDFHYVGWFPAYPTTDPTTDPTTTMAYPDFTTHDSWTCRYNCGYSGPGCSCDSSCSRYGNCCPDFCNYCSNWDYGYCYGTTDPTTDPTTTDYITHSGSCRYNCGYSGPGCSCDFSCSRYGNCCWDFCNYCSNWDYGYCYGTTDPTTDPTTTDSTTHNSWTCRYNCGNGTGACSCSSSCSQYGNCCPDFCDYCSNWDYGYCNASTEGPSYTTPPASWGSCRGNCYGHSGNCSCNSDCDYYGNCCHDFCNYCYHVDSGYCNMTTGHPPCGSELGGTTGAFSSLNYPDLYSNNAYCIWHITIPPTYKVFLTFTDLDLENCGSCGCDSVSIFDGPSTSSHLIAKICQNTSSDSYHSTSNTMTVLFRTDSSVVRRGFRAIYSSSQTITGARVECSTDYMNVVIQRSYLDSMGYNGNDLYLNDQYCRPQISSTAVTFRVALNSCGTVREVSGGRISYTNDVRAYKSSTGEITRQSHMQLRVGCLMERDTMVQIMYVARERHTGNVTGSGRYNVKMAFFTSSYFNNQVFQSPYVVDLNQYLYVQVQLQSRDSNLVIFLDTCVASPSATDFVTRTYDLIRNGCKRDGTLYTYVSGSSNVARFRFNAFKFMRVHPQVYLQCRVSVCQANDNSSRCSQGCLSRRRRDVSPSLKKTTVVLGPIQLKDLKADESLAEKSPLQVAV
ncbi:deleted in malignant brain tumors 1 protein [Amia ocellicauda]|uniref:deleted in malignant brain tumors 1 protein n=1 Tax=Amia ocellicauda TaxID=2972642 RepID=UPI003463C046